MNNNKCIKYVSPCNISSTCVSSLRAKHMYILKIALNAIVSRYQIMNYMNHNVSCGIYFKERHN